MSEIPEDVMRLAIDAFDGSPHKGTAFAKTAPAAIVTIARAILAERERAASVAEAHMPVAQDMAYEPIVSACQDIAKDIRLGWKP